MSHPLCVFAPYVGALSETFIRRHMEDLVPGGTVVVAHDMDGPYGGHWTIDCPVLALNRVRPPRLRRRVVHAAARRLGWRPQDPVVSEVERFLKGNRVQVVLGEYLDLSLRWLEVLRGMGVRFFAHAHGYDVSMSLRDQHWRTQYRRYDEADGVITVSEVMRQRLLGLGLDSAKLHTVPYGVDVPDDPLSRPTRDTVRCVAVGRMVGKKAPILALDAFRRAAEAGPALRLDYIGSGELFPAAQQYVRAFNLADRVTLHGAQPSDVVQQYMRDADIFIQHSITDPETADEEGLPVAILEAMARSLPVVSTRHSGIPEAVVDGVTGYLVEEGDSAGMAERLVEMACIPGLRHRMGEAGWLRVRERFSWEREREGLLRVLGLQARGS